jgi:hypothetical protein
MMPDHPIARSTATGQIVPQGRTAQERAEMQLRKLANVSLTVIAAIDETHGQAEAYCLQGTRSAGQQKRLLERTALVLQHFDEAAIRVQSQAFDAILNRSWNEQPVTRIVEVPVPQKGLIPRLFGRV